MLNETNDIRFEICDEKDLTWEQHNIIHKVLNIAYAFRSKSFYDKTYPFFPPIKRILCFDGSKLIGHTAIFHTKLLCNLNEIAFAGIGMTLSLSPFLNLAYQLRKNATKICKDLNYPLAVGRVKNSERTKNNLKDLVHCFLDIPMIGETTHSHSWETLAIYATIPKTVDIQNIIDHCKQQKCMKIIGEVF